MGIFKKHTIFGKLFKRKAGGTVLGNTIRGVANKLSGGVLGNGLLKQKKGETIEETNQGTAEKVGSIAHNVKAVTQTGDNATVNPYDASLKKGYFMAWLKKNIAVVIAGVVGIAVIIVLIVKKK